MRENIEEKNAGSLRAGYKSLCLRLGAMIIVIFVSRGICQIILSLITPALEGLGSVPAYLVRTALSLLFLDAVPIASAALLLRVRVGEMNKSIYKKPKYLGSALGMFPAFYALALIVNLLTLWVSSFFKQTSLNDSFNTVNELVAPDVTCGIILFVQMVVLAPILEEFWFRGIVMQSLRPYGNGVAIFISAILFGLAHANFAQFFYAALIGIFFGYIAISTGSIVSTTILHAIFNSAAGLILLLLTDRSVGDLMNAAYANNFSDVRFTPPVIAYLVVMGIMMLTIVVGLVMAGFKIAKIKKYRVPKVQNELSAGSRWGMFFAAATVIIGFVLAADSFTVRLIPTGIYKLLSSMIK